MTAPAQPKIYHIVHVDRLPSIISDEYLWCDAEIVRRENYHRYEHYQAQTAYADFDQPSQPARGRLRTVLFLPSFDHALPNLSGE